MPTAESKLLVLGLRHSFKLTCLSFPRRKISSVYHAYSIGRLILKIIANLIRQDASKVNVPIAVRIGVGPIVIKIILVVYTANRILTTMGWSQIVTAIGTFTLYPFLKVKPARWIFFSKDNCGKKIYFFSWNWHGQLHWYKEKVHRTRGTSPRRKYFCFSKSKKHPTHTSNSKETRG